MHQHIPTAKAVTQMRLQYREASPWTLLHKFDGEGCCIGSGEFCEYAHCCSFQIVVKQLCSGFSTKQAQLCSRLAARFQTQERTASKISSRMVLVSHSTKQRI